MSASMKFLVDQDVYAVTTRFLKDLGHDLTYLRIRTVCTEDQHVRFCHHYS